MSIKAKRSACLWLALIVGLGTSITAHGQVRSVTLGIRTHCPYGIRGCWPEIRDGLETPKAIVSITGEPDIETDTCEVKMREDWQADPDMFQRNFVDMRIGVDVRGVEAVVDGQVLRQGGELILRVGKSQEVLSLKPLTQKVQWDKERKQPKEASSSEKKAFEALIASVSKEPLRVRVTGPLRSVGELGAKRVLEVRTFEVTEKRS